MLTQHRTPICLSLVSFDLPIWSIVETDATLYQKDQERFHLLLTEPLVEDFQGLGTQTEPKAIAESPFPVQTPRLLWIEISPYRVIMTMQGNGQFSYRHFWEQGVYGISRYWLQTNSPGENNQIRLRNFTRSFFLKRNPLPNHLRIEYELWTDKLQVGHYVMNLEIQQ
jgi:hypothetical protein